MLIALFLFVFATNMFAIELKIPENKLRVDFGLVAPETTIVCSSASNVIVVSPVSRWSLYVCGASDFKAEENKTIPISRLSWALSSDKKEWTPFSTHPSVVVADQPPTPADGILISQDYALKLTSLDPSSKTPYSARIIYTLLPEGFENSYATPNPFSPDGDGIDDTTIICYTKDTETQLAVEIFNSAGKMVRRISTKETCGQKCWCAVWDGKDFNGVKLADGTYEYRIVDENGNGLESGVVTIKKSKEFIKRTPGGLTYSEKPENPFTITKSVFPQVAYRGDLLSYRIIIRSIGKRRFTDIVVRDVPDKGISYIASSSSVNGKKFGDPVFTDGQLIWRLLSLLDADSVVLEYKAKIEPDCKIGDILNSAFAEITNEDGHFSTEASVARAKVLGGNFSDLSLVWGVVFEDKNGNGVMDRDEPGLPNIAVILDNGEEVLTDQVGRFTFPYVRPGDHLVAISSVSRKGSRTGEILRNIRVQKSSIHYLTFPIVKANERLSQDNKTPKLTLLLNYSADYQNPSRKVSNDIKFFLNKRFSENCSLTVSFDSSEVSQSDRWISDERRNMYINYGDDSKLTQRNKNNLVISFDRNKSYARYGYQNIGIENTQLFTYTEPQEGLKALLWRKNFDISVFGANSKAVRTEERFGFRNDFSPYYLKHLPVVWGSEIVKLVEYDSLTNIIISSRRLQRDIDYTINYVAGRIVILPSMSYPELRGRYFELVVIYQYEPQGISVNRLNYGATGGVYLGDNFSLRAGYLEHREGIVNRNLYGVATSLKLGDAFDISGEIAKSNGNLLANEMIESKNGFAYTFALGLKPSRFLHLYSYLNQASAGFTNEMHLTNKVPSQLLSGRGGNFLSPVGKTGAKSLGSGIIISPTNSISIFAASRIVQSESSSLGIFSPDDGIWAAGIMVSRSSLGDISLYYMDEHKFPQNLPRSRSELERSLNLYQYKSARNYQTSLQYAIKWSHGSQDLIEHEAHSELQLRASKLFSPSFSGYLVRDYTRIDTRLVSNTYEFVLGFTSSPFKYMSLNIFSGIGARKPGLWNSSYYLFRFVNSVAMGKLVTSSLGFELRYGSSRIDDRIAFSGEFRPSNAITFISEYNRERSSSRQDNFLELFRLRRALSFSYRPTQSQRINFYTGYSGESTLENYSAPGIMRRNERASAGVSVYPLRWLEIGFVPSFKATYETSINSWLFTTMLTLRYTISLPLNFELSSYMQGAKKSDIFMEGYNVELAYKFMNLVKLACGYNYSLYGRAFDFEDGIYGYYFRLNAFKYFIGK